MKQIFTLIVLCFTLIRFSEASTISSTSTYNPEYAKGPIKNLISWFQASTNSLDPLVITPTPTDLVLTTEGTGVLDVSITGNTTYNKDTLSVYLINTITSDTIATKIIPIIKGAIKTATTFNNLISGITYKITAETQGAGIPSQKTYTFKLTPPITLTLSYSERKKTCFGQNNGGFLIDPGTNAVHPVYYILVTADLKKDTVKNDTVPLVTGLAAGSYNLYATDANGNVGKITPVVISPNPKMSILVTSKTDAKGCNNGTIAVSGSGGSTDLSYSISGCGFNLAQSSGNFIDLKPCPVYTITTIDNQNTQCTVSTTSDIVQTLPLLTATFTPKSVKCFNDKGSITITAIGGSGKYIYSLPGYPSSTETNSKTYTFSNLPAGVTYSPSVSDTINGCIITSPSPITIGRPAAILAVSLIKQDVVTCNNGSITANATGGSAIGNYTFNISPLLGTALRLAANKMQYTELTSGKYRITVTDDSLCTAQKDTTILPPSGTPLSVSVDTTYITCNDGTTKDGSATLQGIGGNSGHTPANEYKYAYTPAGGTPSSYSPTFTTLPFVASNTLDIGNYSAWVQDGNGCTSKTDFTIAAFNPVTVSLTKTDVSGCNGASTGTVTATAKGGYGDIDKKYTYSIAPVTNHTGDADGVYKNLAAGNYTVTATDSKKCSATSSSITVGQPSKIAITSPTSKSTTCNGSATGEITVSATGGNGSPLSYSLRQKPTIIYNAGKFSAVPAGTYSIIVTDGSCKDSVTNVKVNDAPLLVLIPGTATNVACFGGNTGSIPASATGGTGAYTFSISPNVGTPDIPFTKFSSLPANTTPGYVITVVDANLCSKSSIAIKVTQPAKGVSFKTPIVRNNVLTCPGDTTGSIVVTAQDGTPPYTFTLSPKAVKSTGNPSVTFKDLGARNDYAIRLVDAAGCAAPSDSTGIILTEPAAIVVDTLAGATQIPLCNGAANGSLTFTAKQSGVLVPGTFTLKGAKSGSLAPQTTAGTAVYTNILAADTYTMSFKSTANGCAGSDVVVLAQPSKIVIATPINTTATTCHGSATGTITVTASGGKTGSTLTYLLRQQPSLTRNSLTGTFSGVLAGTYSIIVSDGSCSDSVTNVKVADAALISIVVDSVINVRCKGDNTGKIYARATGGTGSYSFSISPVVGTKDSPFTNFSQLTANSPGYTIRVTDASNPTCTHDTTNIKVSEPAKGLGRTVTISNITTCPGNAEGIITVTGKDGTAPYTVTLTKSGVVVPASKVVQPTTTFDKLSAGNNIYSIKIVDAANCPYTPDTVVSITEPKAIIVDTVAGFVKGPKCINSNDGTITLTATQNGAPIAGTFTLTDAKGVAQAPKTLILPATTVTFTSLPAETYSVAFLSSASNCPASMGNIVLKNPTLLSITKTQVDSVKCNGNANGKITLTATGGTPPYKYYKDGVLNVIPPLNVFDNLASKTYTIQVKDNNNCQTATQNVTVEQPTALQIVKDTTIAIKCAGEPASGQIDITVIGGVKPYTFTLSNGFTNKDGHFKGLTTGTYTYTVTDRNGCSKASPSSLTVGTPTVAFDFAYTSSLAKCNGDGSRITFTTITGGSAPYEYSYDNGTNWTSTSDSLKMKDATYKLIVRMKGFACETASKTVTFVSPTVLSLSATANTILGCYGDKTGTITVTTPTTGTAPYKYALNDTISVPFQTLPTNTFSSLLGGNYKVWVKDANGCKLSINKTITQPTLLGISYSTQLIDATNTKGSITVTDTTGGTGAKSFLVYAEGATPGTYDNTLPKPYKNLAAGSYIVEVKDAKNCIEHDTVLIYNSLSIKVDSSNVTCKNGNDGSITLTPIDGTPSYAYTLFKGGIQKDTKTQTNKVPVTFSPLDAGTYTVTVSDNSNKFFTRNITLKSTDSVTFVATPTPVSCTGTPGGTITVSAVTGSGGYSYYLDGIVNSPSTSNLFSDLPVGNHILKVTDSKNCSTTNTIPIVAVTGITLGIVQPTTSDEGIPNGAFTVIPSGGVNYEYNVNNTGWKPNATKIFSPLAAGSYVVKAREVNTGCISNDTTAIIKNIYNTLDVTPVKTDNNCTGDIKGSIRLHIVGGLSPIIISVKNSSGTAVPSVINSADTLYQNLGNDTYTIDIIDKANKIFSSSVTIFTTSSLILDPLSVTTPICYNDTTVEITAKAQGGNPANYTYTINTNPLKSSSSGNFKNVPVGATYIVTVTDGICSTQKSATVDPRPARIIVTAVGNDATKTITADVTSPVGVYSFKLVPNEAVFTPSKKTWTGLTAGIPYTVYAQNTVGCIDSAAVVTLKNTGPVVIVTDSVCGNGADGTATVTINFGKPTYTCDLWQSSNGKNGPYSQIKTYNFRKLNEAFTISPLASGYYFLKTVDKSAPAISRQDTFYIYSKKVKISSVDADVNNLKLTVHASGGSKAYTYTIKEKNGLPITQVSDSVFLGLTKGTYSVSAVDRKGCPSDTVIVDLKPKLKVVVTGDTVCKNMLGNAHFVISNGTAPYKFKVALGTDTFVNKLLYTQDTTLTLKSGSYYYYLNDPVNDLTATGIFDIVETQIKIDTIFDAKNMTLTVLASGGKAPYQYALDNGVFTNNNVFPISILGTYLIHVKEAGPRFCEEQKSVVLNDSLYMNYNLTRDTICSSDVDGGIIITALNGKAPFTLFAKLNNDPTESVPFDDDTKLTFNNWSKGSYRVYVTDAVGRKSKDTIVNIVAANPIKIKTVIDAKNKTITAHVTGGIKPYRYGLNNWTIPSTPPADSIFTNLTLGTYVVNVEDKIGCSSSDTVDLKNPKLSVNVIMVKDTICLNSEDGEFIVQPRQGKSSYTMSIKKDGIPYTGKYSAKFEVSDTVINVPVGAYQIMLADTAGYVFDSTVNIIAIKPQVQFKQDAVHGTHCGNDSAGKLVIQVSSGKPRSSNLFFYKWDAELQVGTQDTLNSKITDKVTLDKVPSGDHILTLSDSLCTYKQTFNIPSDLPSIFITKDINNSDSALCALPGKLTLNIQGGSPNATQPRYNSYVWKKVTGGNAKDGYTTVILPQYTDSVATDIYAGDYFITVTDSKGCTATNLVPIDVPQYKTDLAITSAVNIKKRTITGFATGGTKPYTFQLNGINNTVATDSVFTVSVNGTYTLTVVDNLGCNASIEVQVLNPHLDVDVIMVKDTICLNSSDGEFIVQPRHGKSSYTMTINKDGLPYKGKYSTEFEISDTVRNVPIGSFHIIVADTAGYVFDSTVNIVSIKPWVNFTTLVNDSTGCGNDPVGKLVVKVWGGTPRSSGLYFYKWDADLLVETQDTLNSAIADTVTLNKVPSGNHYLTVSDSLCTYNYWDNIGSKYPRIDITKDWLHSDTALCIKPGSLTITASGGAPDNTKKQRYSYSWGKVTEQISEAWYKYIPLPETEYNDSVAYNLEPGGYLVWVTDTNKCTDRNYLAFDVPQRNDMRVEFKGYRGGSQFTVTGNDTVCYEESLGLRAIAMAGVDTVKNVKYKWLWPRISSIPTVLYQSNTEDSVVVSASNENPIYRMYAVQLNSVICQVDSSIHINTYPSPINLLPSEIKIGKDDLPYQFDPPVAMNIAGSYQYDWNATEVIGSSPETYQDATLNLDSLRLERPTFTLKGTEAGSNYIISSLVTYGVRSAGIPQCAIRVSTILKLSGGVDPQHIGNNVLTPNDDGYNDFWYIKNAEYYPDINVQVFNRWGQKVYSQKGYDNQSKVWRGNYSGGRLPSGVYYYVITLNGHTKAITGTVTILR